VFWERMVWIRVSRESPRFRYEGMPYSLSKTRRTLFTLAFSRFSLERCTNVAVQTLAAARLIFSLSRPLRRSFILPLTVAIKLR